jgi:hypothetical protein
VEDVVADMMLMSPITIAIALLGCAFLVAFAYLLVDERA